MNDLLIYLVKGLVSKPDSVEVTQNTGENSVDLSLKVDPEDVGMVIGKSGSTIKAIRKLLVTRCLAENQNLKVNLTLQDVNPK